MAEDQPNFVTMLKTRYPFRKMNSADVEKFASQFEEVEYAANDLIYLSDAEGDALYFITGGRVALFRTWKIDRYHDEEEISATCIDGDMFGFEVLEPELGKRLTSARAVDNTTVMKIDRKKMVEMAEAIPGLYTSLSMLYDSFRLSLKIRFSWLNADETVYFVARRHPMVLFKNMLGLILTAIITLPLILVLFFYLQSMWLPLILLITDGVVLTGWLGWTYLDWTNDFSIITNRRVVFQERIVFFYDSRQEVPLYAIQVISIDTDQWGRWFGYGDVPVRSYAGIITLSKVKAPQQVSDLLDAEWYRARATRTRQEKATIAQMFRQRLSGQASVSPERQPVVPKVESSPLQKLLANFFRVRFEKGNVITYRTHWLLLFASIFLPTLSLLVLAGFVFARMIGIINFLTIPVVMGLALLIGIFIFLWWLYRYVDWRNDYYVITDDQVMDVYKKPLGLEDKKVAPLKNIQSVEFSRRGIIGLLFNFGTVSILVGETLLTFDNVFNPAEVQRELFKRIADRDYREKQATISGEQQRIMDMIEIYHNIAEEQRMKRPFAGGGS